MYTKVKFPADVMFASRHFRALEAGKKEAALNQLGVIDYSAVLTDPSLVNDVARWNITVDRARQGAPSF